MRRTVLASVLALILVGADEKRTAPRVELIGVSAQRCTGNVQSLSENLSEERLVVVLRVAGLDRPARAGRVIIREATDDAGTNLVPVTETSAGELMDFPNATKHKGSGNTYEQLPEIDVPVKLRAPDPKTRRIARLKGVITVLAGGPKERTGVKVPGVKSLLGKTVEHPDLARAGVTVQVSTQDELDTTELTILISGKLPREVDASILDAHGKLVSTGGGGSGSKTSFCWQINLRRSLDPTDVLVVTLPTAQQPVTVPFDLKDVELP